MKNVKRIEICIMLVVIMFFTLSFAWGNYKKERDDSAILFKTFEVTGAKAGKIVINGWKVVRNSPARNLDSMFAERAKVIFASSILPQFETSHINDATIISAVGNLNPGVKARVSLIEKQPTIKYQSTLKDLNNERYLILSMEGDADVNNVKIMKKLYDQLMGQDSHKSEIVSGFKEGHLSQEQRDSILNRMAQMAEVQRLERLENGTLVSVTGYSPNLGSMLTLAGKSVNINMAIRYNSVENRTNIYIGNPIITTEY